jgi:hypothetical protein
MRTTIAALIVLMTVVVACGQGPGDGPANATVHVTALAGPICPVESIPPSPDCAPRPVPDAVIIVTDESDNEVARGTTSVDGTATIPVPAGTLVVVPQPVEGLLGTAPPTTITIAPGQLLEVDASYDTGIR